jgi:hypothetical protein
MSLKVNISKVICINLSSLNTEQVFSICEFYKLSFESLMYMKKTDVHKIWVESNSEFAVAASYVCSKDKPVWNEVFQSPTSKEYKKIFNTPVVKVPKLTKTEQSRKNYIYFKSNGYEINIDSFEKSTSQKDISQSDLKVDKVSEVEVVLEENLELDSILDKITDFGMSSLTENEKKFLDNLSKQ